jgi:hypothetical protein
LRSSPIFGRSLSFALVGTMNPTSGDASIFVPLEQTALTQTIEPRRRTALFARYSVMGSIADALGVLAAYLPEFVADWTGCTRAAGIQLMFGLYAVLGIVGILLYRPLSGDRGCRRGSEGAAAAIEDARNTAWLLSSAWIRSAPASWCSH